MLILRSTIILLTCLVLAACGSAPTLATRSARPSLISTEQSIDAAIHAMGLVGTPYRYGGNTVDGGFDCSGLIGYVYRESAGLPTPRTVAQLAGFGEPVPRNELRTGDLTRLRLRPTSDVRGRIAVARWV
ncbi:C40 family peptidase [Variovorax sp. LjRoot175]|uniref:C40 family peptidase n=1 Tax=Variovorax sp. LjRoot175 TaxID=3342276 RepID=UPI003F512E07